MPRKQTTSPVNTPPITDIPGLSIVMPDSPLGAPIGQMAYSLASISGAPPELTPTAANESEPEPDTRRNKGRGTGTSAKSRAVMGVKDNEVAVWVPIIMPKTTRELILNCAKHRNLTMPVYCAATFIKSGLDAAMPTIEAEAAEYAKLREIAEGPRVPKRLTTMTPDQLRAYLAEQNALILQAQAMLDAMPTTEVPDIE